jgi:hypothetical protein
MKMVIELKQSIGNPKGGKATALSWQRLPLTGSAKLLAAMLSIVLLSSPSMIASLHACKRALFLPLLILGAIYTFHLDIYRHYLPYGDDPAVFAASAGNPVLWFTSGFSHYFIVYPGWTMPFTDFLRPGANLILRGEQIAFHQHYSLYFATLYVAQFLLCVTVVLIAFRFGVTRGWLILIGALTAISPAFLGLDLLSAVYPFDIWCGLFTIVAFYLILERRYFSALILLLCAVFTKEAALYSPVAACFTVYVQTRKKLVSAAMLLPLLAWIAVRKVLFIGSVGGVYMLQSHHRFLFLVNMVKGLAQWPSGILDPLSIKHFIADRSIASHFPDLIILLFNVILWGLLLAAGVYALSEVRAAAKNSTAPTPSLLALLVWLCGALSFGVLVGADPRFGGSIYPFELIVCAVIAHRATSARTKQAAVVAVSLLLLAFLAYPIRTEPTMRLNEKQNSASFQKFRTAVMEYRTQVKVIYVLNAPGFYSSPTSIAKLPGSSSDLVILNNLDGCADGIGKTTVRQNQREPIHIDATLPSCAHFVFDSVPPSVLAAAIHQPLRRGTFAEYQFPDIRATGHSVSDPDNINVDFGRELVVDLTPPSPNDFVLLSYNWVDQSYQCIAGDCKRD